MASARNNRLQNRRTALREQQKREREAADAAFKALDDEYDAKVAAAQAVASVVALSGRERAGILLELDAREVTAYLKFAEDAAADTADDATGTDDQGDGGDSGDTKSQSNGDDSGEASGGIPSQSAAAAGASV